MKSDNGVSSRMTFDSTRSAIVASSGISASSSTQFSPLPPLFVIKLVASSLAIFACCSVIPTHGNPEAVIPGVFFGSSVS